MKRHLVAQAFVYKDGFARFTTVPYNTTSDDIDNKLWSKQDVLSILSACVFSIRWPFLTFKVCALDKLIHTKDSLFCLKIVAGI